MYSISVVAYNESVGDGPPADTMAYFSIGKLLYLMCKMDNAWLIQLETKKESVNCIGGGTRLGLGGCNCARSTPNFNKLINYSI